MFGPLMSTPLMEVFGFPQQVSGSLGFVECGLCVCPGLQDTTIVACFGACDAVPQFARSFFSGEGVAGVASSDRCSFAVSFNVDEFGGTGNAWVSVSAFEADWIGLNRVDVGCGRSDVQFIAVHGDETLHLEAAIGLLVPTGVSHRVSHSCSLDVTEGFLSLSSQRAEVAGYVESITCTGITDSYVFPISVGESSLSVSGLALAEDVPWSVLARDDSSCFLGSGRWNATGYGATFIVDVDGDDGSQLLFETVRTMVSIVGDVAVNALIWGSVTTDCRIEGDVSSRNSLDAVLDSEVALDGDVDANPRLYEEGLANG